MGDIGLNGHDFDYMREYRHYMPNGVLPRMPIEEENKEHSLLEENGQVNHA